MIHTRQYNTQYTIYNTDYILLTQDDIITYKPKVSNNIMDEFKKSTVSVVVISLCPATNSF